MGFFMKWLFFTGIAVKTLTNPGVLHYNETM